MTQLDPDVAAVDLTALVPDLVAQLPAVLDELADEMTVEWPDYAQFLTGARDEVAGAAQVAIERIVGGARNMLLGEPTWPVADEDGAMALFTEIGRTQWQAGVPLAPLLSVYQSGARTTWRRMARTAVGHRMPAPAVAALAEAMFSLVDQLCAATTRGYLDEQSRAAADRERARGDLVELLLSDRCDTRLVEVAAARAGWPVPASVAVVLVEPTQVRGGDLAAHGEDAWLTIRHPDATGVLVPDPARPGGRGRLTAALRGRAAVVGPTVAPTHLPAALRITQVAARLRRDGVLVDDPVFVDDHLDAVIVHRDPRLLAVLQERVLAPLAGLAPDNRERLAATLTSWLCHLGDRQRTAADLHVHPQTVRYRLARLRELFGPVLDDPAMRLKLLLALAWGSPPADPDSPAAAATTRARPEPTAPPAPGPDRR